MSDLDFQKLSTVQNNLMPAPTTIASATPIAPTGFLTFISGTANIVTITPPVTGAHMLCLVFTNGSPGQFTTAGNIKTTLTTIAQWVPVFLVYDPATQKYYQGRLSA